LSLDAGNALPASPQPAYVLLAPDWDPEAEALPASYIVLQSLQRYGLDLNTTLTIPVDDRTFAGNCAAGSFLPQAQADYITQRIFPTEAGVFTYDAATCTTTLLTDGGTP
jgi:hypothetical protein